MVRAFQDKDSRTNIRQLRWNECAKKRGLRGPSGAEPFKISAGGRAKPSPAFLSENFRNLVTFHFYCCEAAPSQKQNNHNNNDKKATPSQSVGTDSFNFFLSPYSVVSFCGRFETLEHDVNVHLYIRANVLCAHHLTYKAKCYALK